MLLDRALGDSLLHMVCLLWPLPAASAEYSHWLSGRGDDSVASSGVTAVDPERVEWVEQFEVHGKITGVCISGEFTGACTSESAQTMGLIQLVFHTKVNLSVSSLSATKVTTLWSACFCSVVE